MRVGFACLSNKINTKYQTFRLANFSQQRLYQTIKHNLSETERTIKHCIHDGYKLFRMSSDIIPFASHEVMNGIDYISWFKDELQQIGKLIKDNDIRISMHPGQTVNINSPKEDVVTMSIKDIEYHYNIINAMGVKGDIVIHTGGVYGDKSSATQRFIDVYNNLPQHIKDYLVLENDDKSYTVDDVMLIHYYTGVPIVLDLHHHYCHLSEFDVADVFDTWRGKGKPKIHISSPRSSDSFRSHADYIDFDYVKDFFMQTKNMEYDVCVEAKLKDMAVDRFVYDYKEVM